MIHSLSILQFKNSKKASPIEVLSFGGFNLHKLINSFFVFFNSTGEIILRILYFYLHPTIDIESPIPNSCYLYIIKVIIN